MSLSEAKSQVRQFSAAQYLADPEGSQEAALEEVANVYVLAGDLDDEADWDMAYSTGGSNLSSQDSILGDYWRIFKAC